MKTYIYGGGDMKDSNKNNNDVYKFNMHEQHWQLGENYIDDGVFPVNIIIPPKVKKEECRRSKKPNREYNLRSYQPDSSENYNPKDNLFKMSSFSYQLNRHLFRCDNFEYLSVSRHNKIFVLGCSYTMGIGLPEHLCWPFLITKKLAKIYNVENEWQIVNLAVTGAGYSEIDMYLNYIDKFPNVKYLFVHMPPLYRNTYLINKNRLLHNFHTTTDHKTLVSEQAQNCHKNFLDKLKNAPLQFQFEEYKVLQKIRLIGRILNIPTIITSVDNTKIQFNTLARDLAHPGPDYHNKLADVYIHEFLNNAKK